MYSCLIAAPAITTSWHDHANLRAGWKICGLGPHHATRHGDAGASQETGHRRRSWLEQGRENIPEKVQVDSLRLTGKAPPKWWFFNSSLFSRGLFSGALAVSFREGNRLQLHLLDPHPTRTPPGREGLEMVQFVRGTIFHWAHHFPQRGLWEGRGRARLCWFQPWGIEAHRAWGCW